MPQTPFTHLHDDAPWMLAEDIPDMDLFFSQIWIKSFVNNLQNSCGKNYQKVLAVYRGYHQQFYYGEKDCHDFAKHLLSKLKSEPAWGDAINENIVQHSDALVHHSKTIQGTHLKNASNAELWQHYDRHVQLHTELYEWGWLPNAVDMFFPELTNHLKAILRSHAENEEQVNTWFVCLTTSEKETIASQEHKDLVRLALEIRNDERMTQIFQNGTAHAMQHTPEELKKQFRTLHEKYKHLKFMYHGRAGRLEDVYFALEALLNDKKDLAEELKRIENLSRNANAAKEKLFTELNLPSKHKHLFDVFAEFMYTKWYRRNAQIMALYHFEPLLLEIGQRLGLTLQHVRTLLWPEVKAGLLEKKYIIPEEIDSRFSYYAYYVEKGREAIFLGNRAEALEKKAKTLDVDQNLQELFGQTACLGKAVGTVRIVLGPKDLSKMKKGDVLVAIATDPDVVPGMKIASAIVTEQGGVTSHAAIVSRELGVPCVIGTKIATKWLKNGDRVEVDATKGIVRKLS